MTGKQGDGLRVLLIEDSDDRAEVIQASMQSFVHWARAKTAREAERFIERELEQWRVVFLDYDLSSVGGQGLWLSKQIADREYTGLVIVHSANVWGGPKMVATLRDAGVRVVYVSCLHTDCFLYWKNLLEVEREAG